MADNIQNPQNTPNTPDTTADNLSSEREGLYTSSANLISENSQGHGGCGCGCNHDHDHGAAQAPAHEGHSAHGAHGEGCGCGCGEKDYTDPDVVREDGTNPAVTTVEDAAGYDQNAAWNDGARPAEGEASEASGAVTSDEDHIN